MLDPWTAFSLASGIAQFVDFGGKLIKEAKEIKEKGSSSNVINLKTATQDLLAIIQRIQGEHSASVNNTSLDDEQEALNALAVECTKEATKLVELLQGLRVADINSKKKALHVTLKAAWKRSDMDSLDGRLNRFRAQLGLRMVAIWNSKNNENGQNIIEVLSINRALKSTVEDLRSSSLRTEETVAAILTFQNGDIQTIHRSDKGGIGSTSITYRQPAISPDSSHLDDESHGFTTNLPDFSDIPGKILHALYYRTIDERRDLVADAYKNTFQWIYRDPEAYQKPWANFVTWLKTTNGCYWINGKAGSGKSTLMKYILFDPRTRQMLNEWAGDDKLLIASFFFWNTGTSLQKSQVGLFRSLLLEVLTKRPDWVPVVFPSLCRTLASHELPSLRFSYSELRKAFTILVGNLPPNTKLCLFVDGIDEYEGDHRDIAETFLAAGLSDNIKMVISSRPIPACESTFSTCPGLRLQDLTIEDIERYVEENLSGHDLIRELEMTPEGLGTTEALQLGITSKASGVFLWVVLVVKSLLIGLDNYDTKQDLLLRLDRLPADLEKLYKHMLGSVSEEYQRSASLMIQLVLRSTEVQSEDPMTVLQLSFAEQEAPQDAIDAPIEEITASAQKLRCKATEGRMRSRCCGLIEAHDTSAWGNELRVGFLHRSVIEFLRSPAVWRDLLALTQGPIPGIDELLLASSLSELKRKYPTSAPHSRAWLNSLHCLNYCVALEKRTGLLQTTYLNELYTAMEFYEKVSTTQLAYCVANCLPFHGSSIRPFSSNDILWPESLSLLNFLNGHTPETTRRLKSGHMTPKLLNQLLLFMVLSFTAKDDFGHRCLLQQPRTLASANALLENGANPNEMVGLVSVSSYYSIGVTLRGLGVIKITCDRNGEIAPWAYMVQYLSYPDDTFIAQVDPEYMLGICSLIEHMVLAGADLGLSVLDRTGYRRSASYFVEKFLLKVKDKSPYICRVCETVQKLVHQRVLTSKAPGPASGGVTGLQTLSIAKKTGKLSRLLAKIKS